MLRVYKSDQSISVRLTMTSLEKVVQLLKSSKGFYKVLDKLKVISASNGVCTAEIKVSQEHTNPMGGLHGGFSATLIDVISSASLKTLVGDSHTVISTEMNLIYTKGAKVGDELVVEGRTLRKEDNIVHLEAELKNKKTGDLLVKGSHIAYLKSKKDV